MPRSWVLLVLVSLSIGSCSGEGAARQQADEFVQKRGWVRDLHMVNVSETQTSKDWVFSYSAKGEALGGPIVVGVDKNTKEARLIEGYQ